MAAAEAGWRRSSYSNNTGGIRTLLAPYRRRGVSAAAHVDATAANWQRAAV